MSRCFGHRTKKWLAILAVATSPIWLFPVGIAIIAYGIYTLVYEAMWGETPP